MTESDARRAIVSPSEAQGEIEGHGHAWAAFVADYGDQDEYRGIDVLEWLGY